METKRKIERITLTIPLEELFKSGDYETNNEWIKRSNKMWKAEQKKGEKRLERIVKNLERKHGKRIILQK